MRKGARLLCEELYTARSRRIQVGGRIIMAMMAEEEEEEEVEEEEEEEGEEDDSRGRQRGSAAPRE